MSFRPAVAASGVVVLMAFGCSSTPRRSATPTTTSPVSSTSVATTAPGATGGPTTSTSGPASTTATSGAATGGHCATAGLAVSVTDLGAAAGTGYRELLFKNTTARACTMQGYPGVSFVDARGRQVGAPVARMNGAGGTVNLVPGTMAAALIAYHDVYVATFPTCQPAAAEGIRIYPPHETASLTVSASLMVCANPEATGTAGISPVTNPANLHP